MVIDKFMKKFNASNTPKKKSLQSHTPACPTVTFGLPLSELCERDKSDIPTVVLDIFEFLLHHHGLEAEGIFRVNGNLRTVEALRNSIDENRRHWHVLEQSLTGSESERGVDVFSVASLLKLYLRELPDGLIPESITSLFLQTYLRNRSNKSSYLLELEQLICHLPASNYTLLQHLCLFLHKILNYQAENKMSAEALGIVFGPNVFRLNPDVESIHDQGTVNRIMALLIENVEQLFRMTAPSCASISQKRFFSQSCDTEMRPRPTADVTQHVHSTASNKPVDSNSSGTDSLSQSTTLGYNDATLKRGRTRNGFSEHASVEMQPVSSTTNTLKPNDFSAGLATAIRICIEEHVFGLLHTSAASVSSCGSTRFNETKTDIPHLHTSTSDATSGMPVDFGTTPIRGRSLYERQVDRQINQISSRPEFTSSTRSDSDSNPKSDDQLTSLTQRLHEIKSRLRDHERQFEGAWGRKPSLAEKRADSQIRELMDDLSNIRSTIRQIKVISPNQSALKEVDMLGSLSGEERVCSEVSIKCHGESISGPSSSIARIVSKMVEPATNLSVRATPIHCDPLADKTNRAIKALEKITEYDAKSWLSSTNDMWATLPTRTAQPPSSPCPKSNTLSRKSQQSLNETYAVLIHRLTEKRLSANRPEALHLMTLKQVEEEKIALQKALLYFEGLHGRPRNRHERLIMRPLYDRYRSVKRLLGTTKQKSDGLSGFSQTITDPTKTVCAEHLQRPMYFKVDLVVDDGGSDTQSNGCPSTNATDGNTATPDEQTSAQCVFVSARTGPQTAQSSAESEFVWPSCGSSSRTHNSNVMVANKSPFVSKKVASFNNEDEENPVCVANTDGQRYRSTVSRVSDTLPATSVAWATSRSNIPLGYHKHSTGASTMQPEQLQPRKNEEWFGSFRSTINHSNPQTARFGSTGLSTNGLNSVSSQSPAHKSSVAGHYSRPHSPVRSISVAAESVKKGSIGDRGDPSDPQQKLIMNRRVLSSPTENPSSNSTCSKNPQSPRSSDLVEWSIAQLQAELQTVHEFKRQLQKTLKEFEHEFQRATGHKVERTDRLCMRAEYNQYKMLKTRLSQLESELTLRMS